MSDNDDRLIYIPTKLLEDRKISDGAYIFYAHLLDQIYLRKTNTLEITNKELEKICNKSTTTIKKYINQLKDNKYIYVNYVNRKRIIRIKKEDLWQQED